MDYRPMRLMRTMLPGRWLALTAVVLLAHAVAVSTLHTHRRAGASGRAESVAGLSTLQSPSDDGSATDPSSNCPTCQLQQGFAFEAVTYDTGSEVEVSEPRADEARLRAVLRAADTSPPDRAPPSL
jgi:hypothetical protein